MGFGVTAPVRVAQGDYDKVVSAHSAYVKGSDTDQHFAYGPILAQLEPLAGKRILDYGAGPGRLAQQLAAGGAESVVGVDISGASMDAARRDYPSSAHPNLSFQQIASGDLSKVPGAGSFDAAVLSFVLCTMPDRGEIVGVLQGIRSVLKPGGELMIAESNWEKSNGADFISFSMPKVDQLRSGESVRAILKGKDGEPDLETQDYFWSQKDYAEMLGEAGFRVRSIAEPVAALDEPGDWLDERRTPPNVIITAVESGVSGASDHQPSA